jgi:hypothetical protein
MKYLIRKEIAGFFSSAMGYVILLVWFLAASLMLWFFDGEYNLPDGGYATLRPFFLCRLFYSYFWFLLQPCVCLLKKTGWVHWNFFFRDR